MGGVGQSEPSREFRGTQVRREGAPNCVRGGRAPQALLRHRSAEGVNISLAKAVMLAHILMRDE